MIIAVTALDSEPDCSFDTRFGRARFILVYDTHKDEWQALDNSANTSAQSGAGIAATELLTRSGAGMLLTGHVGPKAERALAAAGIEVRLGDFGSPREAVASVSRD
jgi:predicted Fe-Mo cluster-binding NifX family protein